MSVSTSGAPGRNVWLLAVGSLLVVLVLSMLLIWPPAHRGSTGGSGAASGKGLFFYCAAGTRVPVTDVTRQYQDETFGQRVEIQFGGSNTLLSQLSVSGIGDLYLAADRSYLEQAQQRGLVQETIPLATLVPVVAVAKGNPKNIRTLDDLLRADVRLSLGNPEAPAIGKKTRLLLQAAGKWQDIERHATDSGVFKPTVNDVANDVVLEAVDAGIVWDAVAAQFPEIDVVHLDELDRGASEIVVGVLASSKRPTAALQFARYLAARDKGLPIFQQHHFKVVEGDVWQLRPTFTIYSGGVNRAAIESVIADFAVRENAEINTVYNGCGILTAQMKSLRSGVQMGVFPEAYFACDVSFMEQVQDEFDPAINVSQTDMVLLTRPGNPRNIRTCQDLTQDDLKLGLANPDESALGELSRRLLSQLELYEAVQKNVSTLTPTADLLVNQVKVGGLDVAIVYRANTSKVRDELAVIDIEHPRAQAVQPYAIAREAQHRRTIERLLDRILASVDKFEAAGFRRLAPANSHESK